MWVKEFDAIKVPKEGMVMMGMEAVQPTNEVKLPEKIAKKVKEEEKVEKELKKEAETLEETVELLNKTSMVYDRGLNFTIHKETDRIIVRVLNKETDEVIREVPKEEILDLIAEMYQLSGIFLNKVA